MVRIDCLIFGYRKLNISCDDLSKVSSLFINHGIFSSINNKGVIIVRERDFVKIRNILQGRVDFSFSEPMGLLGKWKRIKYKKTLISALVSSLAVFLLSSLLIWDVRVDGNTSIPDSEIIVELANQGFEVGKFWKLTDTSAIETAFLRQNDGISWININRRGTVAYVSVVEREKEDVDSTKVPIKYTNIVANEDCIIEEITVMRGTPMVKPGDVVKKGDVLIAGIIPTEAGGLCTAEGVVMGRVSERIDVNVTRNQDVRVPNNKKIYSITLNFFDFSLNIFKLYRNLTNECDIIDYEKSYSLLGRCKLPFSMSIKYITEYRHEKARYSDSEIVKIATNRLNGLIATRLVGCDLLKMKTLGDFNEKGYYMYSDITYLCPVGESRAFEAD